MDILKNFFNSYEALTQEENEELWRVVGEIDVSSLNNSNFLSAYDFWCGIVSNLFNEKIKITPKLILYIIRASIVSFKLCKKSMEFGKKSTKAVESILGLNYENMFDEIVFEELNFVENKKDLDECLIFVDLILAKMKPEPPNLINLMFWILDFSMKYVGFDEDKEMFDFITENSRRKFIKNLPDKIKDPKELKTDINVLYYLIARYLFEQETDTKPCNLIEDKSFFENLIQNNNYEDYDQYPFVYYKTEPISLFEYVLCDKIDYRFIALFALSNLLVFDDPDLILNSIPIQINRNTAFFYVLLQNTKSHIFLTFLENVLTNKPSKEWKDFIDFIFNSVNISKSPKILLIQLNNNIKSAAIELLKTPEYLSSIDPSKNQISNILYHILTKDVLPYDENNFDIITIIEIWKTINTDKNIDLTKLYVNLTNILINKTKEFFGNNIINLTAIFNDCQPSNNKIIINEKNYSENIAESFFEDFSSDFDLINLYLSILLNSTRKQEGLNFYPFTMHYLISKENKKIIKEKFNISFSSNIAFEGFKLAYQSIKENDKSELITILAPLFRDIEFTQSAIKLFIEKNDSNAIELFFKLDIDNINQVLGSFAKDELFNMYFNYAPLNLLYDFIISSIKNKEEEFVFIKLGEYSHKNPSKIINLLEKISPNNNQISIILNHILKPGDNVSSELIELLVYLTSKHKNEKYINPPEIRNKNTIPYDWPDEQKKNENQDEKELTFSGRINPWDEETDIGECTFLETGRHFEEQHWFYCYTCGLTGSTGCCLPCAYKCHKGHKLVYSKSSSFYCDCYESGKCMFNNHKEQKCSNNKFLPLELQTNTALNLFSELIKIDYIKEPDNEKCMNKFNKFFSDSIKQVDTIFDESLLNIQKIDKDFPNQNILFSSMSSIFEGNLNKLIERFTITPILLSCICNNKLIFSIGNIIHLYSNDFHLLTTYELESPALRLLTSPDNNSIFAASSTTQIFINSVEESEIKNIKIIQIPQLISFEWVPKKNAIVALTDNNLIVINNVMGTENLTKYDFTYKIISFTIVPYEDKMYCIYISNKGKYDYFQINSQIDEELSFEYTFKNNVNSIILSYSPESELLFFSCSEKDLLYAININDFFENKRNEISIHMNASLNLKFIGLHPKNPFIHIFQHISSCAIYAVIFNEKHFGFIQISKRLSNSSLPLLECDMSNLACFSINGNQYFINPSGEFYQIDYEQEEKRNVNPTFKQSSYTVPLKFWTLCYETKDIDVQTSNCCIMNNENELEGIIFSFTGESKYLKISASNTSNILVGFIIYPNEHKNSNYYYYKMNDRYFKGSKVPTMIPLKPSEVGISKEYTIEFETTKNIDIIISGIKVYAINKDDLSPTITKSIVEEKNEKKTSNDWENDGNTLFDFIDTDIHDLPDKKHNLLYNLSRSISGEFKEDKMREIITYIYQYPEYSNYCRSIVLKSSKDKKEQLLEIWKETIIYIAENKISCDWTMIWRDIYMMPKDKRSEILSKIWDYDPKIEGDYAIIDSFF